MQAEQLVRDGNLDEALSHLQQEIRDNPSDAKLRVFLFQLYCVQGDWDRALAQLNVAAEMDASTLLMAQVCREALHCEALRSEIFAGRRSPMVFGEPPEWVGWMIQANQMAAEEQFSAAQQLRDRAFEAAQATPGTINDQPFEWIADADVRLGPMLEAIVDGRYYWVPFQNISDVQIEPPKDLRDVVWAPARFTWVNGGETVGLVPTRYAGSENSDDSSIRLARRTEWIEREGGLYMGLGQRMLATNEAEYPLLDVRRITLGVAEAQQPGGEAPDG